jgi:hypothetical protein
MASADVLTLPFMLTKSMHRDVYPAIDPAANEKLIASSKVVMVFGATSGVGFVSCAFFFPLIPLAALISVLFIGRRQVLEHRQSRSYCPRWS